MLEEGAPLPLPPTGEPALTLWRHLLDAGPYAEGGMGRSALSWADLRAWQLGAAQPLAPWQLRAMRRASQAWVAEHVAAAKPEAPAPWSAAPSAVEREVVRDKVRAIFGQRAKARPDAVKAAPP